jgi:hypothetical protein
MVLSKVGEYLMEKKFVKWVVSKMFANFNELRKLIEPHSVERGTRQTRRVKR